MKKWMLGLLAAALAGLCGCSRAETVWETVDDALSLPAAAAAEPQMELVFDVPPDAVCVGEGADCRVFTGPDEAYEIIAQTLPSGDVGAMIRAVSGFSPEQLRTVLHQEGPTPEYSFSWYAEGEDGGVIYRAQVLAEGDYCYALTFGVREGDWSDYDSTAAQVFASLGLISAENA